MRRPSARGMTLLEVSIALAIIGVLAAMSYAGYEALGARSGPPNAANDLTGAMSEARARAVERDEDVWLIVYENINTAGEANTGSGAWFLLEDRRRDFNAAVPPSPGDLTYATFAPPSAIRPTEAQGRLMDTMYLDDYPKRSVRFGVSGALTWSGVFAGLAASPCSFCSGTPRRGALVFRGDGSVLFVDGTGNPVVPAGVDVAQRAASLGLVSSDNQREFLFAVSGPVGFVDSRSR